MDHKKVIVKNEHTILVNIKRNTCLFDSIIFNCLFYRKKKKKKQYIQSEQANNFQKLISFSPHRESQIKEHWTKHNLWLFTTIEFLVFLFLPLPYYLTLFLFFFLKKNFCIHNKNRWKYTSREQRHSNTLCIYYG